MKTNKARTKEELKMLVSKWSAELNIFPKNVRVQKMKRKWASCSSSGWISLNCELTEKSRDFQDYVIVHELLHIKIPNHGKLFKNSLAAIFHDRNVGES